MKPRKKRLGQRGTKTMRTIIRRLRRLQERFAPEVREEDFRLAELLRERRRRRWKGHSEK